VLRAVIGEAAAEMPNTEPITVIETMLDDMSPELFPPLLEAVMAAGARDAFLTPVQGKKGRPAQLVTALCDAAQVGPVSEAVFANAPTLGLRMHEERRVCLDRRFEPVATPWGEVRVKVGRFNGRATVASPEFEDCRRLAQEAGVPVREVYAAATAAAREKGLQYHG
jgi:hypothetical protein